MEAINGCSKDLRVEYHVRDGKSRQHTKKNKTIKVDIPPGVDEGMSIRVPDGVGEGVGDVLVSVAVAPDPYFKRDGIDIHVDLDVSLAAAVLGGNVDVLTLDGMVTMKIPAGTQPLSKMLLKGKGVRDVTQGGARRGNQYVHLKITIPKDITEKQKQLLAEFDIEEEKKRAAAGKGSSFVQSAWERLKNFVAAKK